MLFYANLIWHARGEKIDYNFQRMHQDWYDGKKMAGYEFIDDILTNSQQFEDHPLHNYLYCLCYINTYDFKKIKAYYIWLKEYHKIEYFG